MTRIADSVVVKHHGGLRIERLTTSGEAGPGDGRRSVGVNAWIIGSDYDVVVIDAPHAPEPIVTALDNRNVSAVICTHGHSNHIRGAVDLAVETFSPVLLHPADDSLWKAAHSEVPYFSMHCGQRIGFAGTELTVIHTPGHSAGSVCLWLPDLGAVVSGDTLFRGGPGEPEPTACDSSTILGSIKDKLFKLPIDTVVCPGHGGLTRIGDELADYYQWSARGRFLSE
jgi:glyoxylase-like metal-dependent hydrolase (beta-lactamase superfamily II)